MKRSNMPFLTIGIASYNYARYLPKAFEQIKKQKFRDFEVLYCDDGSTDNSVEVIQTFIKENPDMNIRLVTGENAGLLGNKNRILEHAEGEYLLICDADDYMTENCLEALCKAAQEQNADCVIGGFSEIDENGTVYKQQIPPKDSQNANKWIYIWHHAQIYKMDLVKKHNLKFSKVPDDVCVIQKIHQYAEKTAFVSESLYCWVRHSDSTSRDIDTNAVWHPRKLWHNIVDCMLEIQEDICRQNLENNKTIEYDKIESNKKENNKVENNKIENSKIENNKAENNRKENTQGKKSRKRIKETKSDNKDIWQMRYFLYKWFYLNMTDLPVSDKKELKKNIKTLQRDMKRICPKYRNPFFFKQAFVQQDTLFARMLVLICWLAEGLGCIWLLPMARNKQLGMREK